MITTLKEWKAGRLIDHSALTWPCKVYINYSQGHGLPWPSLYDAPCDQAFLLFSLQSELDGGDGKG